jgi:hypothetical protein
MNPVKAGGIFARCIPQRHFPVMKLSWTRSPVPGNRLADKPVYVLTSASTWSGAEQFSYDLKMLRRATLVGETTGGGAHAGVFHRRRSLWHRYSRSEADQSLRKGRLGRDRSGTGCEGEGRGCAGDSKGSNGEQATEEVVWISRPSCGGNLDFNRERIGILGCSRVRWREIAFDF